MCIDDFVFLKIYIGVNSVIVLSVYRRRPLKNKMYVIMEINLRVVF